MIVGIKDGIKLFAISIMACCAVFVCTMFINYNMDLTGVREQVTGGAALVLYDAYVSMGKVISAVAGGCLLVTSGIMLLFYIKNYIDTHKKELGILKALGYSNLRIARDFWIFAVSILTGALLGFGGAFLIMPTFYRTQNEEGLFPDFGVQFHPSLMIALVVIPTLIFGILAILYACLQLRRPTIDLLKEKMQYRVKSIKEKKKEREGAETAFLKDVQSATLRGKKALLFFVIFGSFCYSSMMQMSASMDELASEMFAIIMFVIGVTLAGITLFLAITTVVHGNTKTISMMRVFGYTSKECERAVLGGYRIPAYIGFAIGTVYQYGLLKMMLTVIFKDWEDIPEYTFDVQTCIIVLISFIILYELIMRGYAAHIKKISIKEVMIE
ncbi:MAG: ABC transporter permease [Clostridium sp.]|nr:ABC transporter permease [Clostridium sp.]